MEYCNFSYQETRELPVRYRRWFIERKQKELETRKEAEERAAKRVPKR